MKQLLFYYLLLLPSLLLLNCYPSLYNYNIEHYYDEFDGYTKDIMKGNRIHMGSYPIWLNAQRIISKSGERSYSLIIELAFADWLFIEKGNSLTLLLDGNSLNFYGEGSKNYREVVSDNLGGYVYEKAFYDITPEQLRMMAQAKEIKLKLIGSKSFVTETCREEISQNFKTFVRDFVDK